MVLRGERISNDPDLLDNLQAWAENNYDTRLLHRNLAFPLLKRLVDVGDPNARICFAEEIARRAESGYLPVIQFLVMGDYFDYLPPDYINSLVRKTNFLNQFASEHKLMFMPNFIKIIASYIKMINKEDVDFSQNSLTINDFLEAYKEVYLFFHRYRDPIEEEDYLNFEISLLKIIYQGIGQKYFIPPPNVEEVLFSVLNEVPELRNCQDFRKSFVIPIISNCLDESIAIIKKISCGELNAQNFEELKNLKHLSEALDFNIILSEKYKRIYADIVNYTG